ncbi:hypothetical protein BU16DRAFT_511024 [Lophium mytilinum]|uniref:Uncharacterized protein n=1 Tax=Lophium mytilinum TaxID=390894 RepID=A0A6A6QR87_9PEZI|nr:hypothetical protein BU16DRAFT_511024 [Lophium mytilinum]
MQHPSTALTPSSLISLRLVKFSSAVDPSGEAEKFSWKHTTQDLVVVFDSFRDDPLNHAGQPSKMMKVIQGTKILESVDIEGKIREANNVIDTFRQLNVEIRHDQLPISGLIRNPLLALRYTLADSKTRRVQLKFASDNDFNMVYDLLTGMGCQIVQSLPGGSTAPPTATTSVESTGPSFRLSSSAYLPSKPEETSSTGIGSSGMPFTSLQPSVSRDSAYSAPPSRALQRTWTPHAGSSRPSSSIDLPPLPRPSFSEHNRNATEPSQIPEHAPKRPTTSTSAASNTRQAPPSAASSIDRVVAQISAEASSSLSSTNNLAFYAAQTGDDRATVISDWMMQHIEDDGFMTLCEDVLGCWRRIGLGL